MEAFIYIFLIAVILFIVAIFVVLRYQKKNSINSKKSYKTDYETTFNKRNDFIDENENTFCFDLLIYGLYKYFNKNESTFTFIQDEFVTADTLAFIYYTMVHSIKNEYKIDFDDMKTEDFVEIIVNGLSSFICQELEYNQKRLSYFYNDRKEHMKLFFKESFEENNNEQKSLSYLIKFANLVKFDKKELHFKKFEEQNDSINSFLSNNLIVEASELYMITRHLTGELLLSILEINEKELKAQKNTEYNIMQDSQNENY